MKKWTVGIFAFLIGLCLVGCSKFDAVSCASPISRASDEGKFYYQPDLPSLNFDKKVETDGITFYIEHGTKDKIIDHAIDSVLLAQKVAGVPSDVYIASGATRVLDEGLFVSPASSPEMIGAVLLGNGAKEELPFGVFAGVSAALLDGDCEFTRVSPEEAEAFSLGKELQYPLYLENYAEKDAAWTFAKALGALYLQDHAPDFSKTDGEEVVSFFEEHGAALPDFFCPMPSGEYPLQVRTEHVHFYFACNFCDMLTGEGMPDYDKLRSIALDSESLLEAVGGIYNTELSSPVDVFFGKKDDFGLLTNVVSWSDFSKHAIPIYSFSCLGRELSRQITYQTGDDGYGFGYVLADYYASEYSDFQKELSFRNYMLDFSRRAEEAKVKKEDQKIYQSAKERYDLAFGKTDEAGFSVKDYENCLAYVVSEDGGKPTQLCAWATFARFVYENYGHEKMIEINRGKLEISEMEELYRAWFSDLKAKVKA